MSEQSLVFISHGTTLIRSEQSLVFISHWLPQITSWSSGHSIGLGLVHITHLCGRPGLIRVCEKLKSFVSGAHWTFIVLSGSWALARLSGQWSLVQLSPFFFLSFRLVGHLLCLVAIGLWPVGEHNDYLVYPFPWAFITQTGLLFLLNS